MGRLVLLDLDALRRVVPVVGLGACRNRLRRTLDGQTLRRVREHAGLDSLNFCIEAPDDAVLDAADVGEGALDDESIGKLWRVGTRVLFAASTGNDPSMARRLRLKFSRETRVLHGTKPVGRWSQPRPALTGWIEQQVVPQVIPQWTWLFS